MTPDVETLGKYQLLEELGRGGFATVYRALNTSLDREEALKVLHPQLLVDPGFVARFLREARAIANLRHPHIVTVYEVGNADGRLFIAMELALGSDLGRATAERERIPWTEALDLLRPVCEALDYAHAQKVVHRDLKPSNILLDPERGPLLSDFGFARLMGGSSQSLSLSGGILGTPAYIAPEVWELDAATPAADIYALGCIAFEMLTGQVLFTGATPIQAMRAHDRGPVLPQAWPEGVPVGVAEVLGKALAREPGARYSSATALWHALNDLEARAQAEREAAERAAVAGQWRAEAEVALAAGELSAARMAAGRWLAAAPEDGEAKAFLERVREAAATEEAAERARVEAEQRAQQESEDLARREAEERARREAELRVQREAQERSRREAGTKARRDDEERTRLEAEAKARREAEKRARREVEESQRLKAQQEAREDEQPAVKRRRLPVWVLAAGGLLLVAVVVVAAVLASRQAASERERVAWALTLQAKAQTRATDAQRTATAQAQETAWAVRIGTTQSATTTEAEASRRAATAQANTAYQTETAVVQAEATAQGATSTAQAEATRQNAMSTAQAQAAHREATKTATARAGAVATVAAQIAHKEVGPFTGVLVQEDDDLIHGDIADVSVTDFAAEARFYNPFPPTEGLWDYGFVFRGHYYARVTSTGQWCHNSGPRRIEVCGEAPYLETIADESNVLRLIVLGDEGQLWVNNRFVTSWDLSGTSAADVVWVANGIKEGFEIDGRSTRYDSFCVWSLTE